MNCVSIGSNNSLPPEKRQAIIWTNATVMSFEPLGINFSKIWVKIAKFSFKKMHLEMSSAKRQPFCLGLNVLILQFYMGPNFGHHSDWRSLRKEWYQPTSSHSGNFKHIYYIHCSLFAHWYFQKYFFLDRQYCSIWLMRSGEISQGCKGWYVISD